jgi:hypothetical protein
MVNKKLIFIVALLLIVFVLLTKYVNANDSLWIGEYLQYDTTNSPIPHNAILLWKNLLLIVEEMYGLGRMGCSI